MAEDLHTEDYRGPLGPAELVQFEPGPRSSEVQLAERYSEPGLGITWEGHPNTMTSDPDHGKNRLAIITDNEDNPYFLAGRKVYDINASRRAGKLVGVKLSDRNPMPDLQIGHGAFFTGRNTVQSVLIATERVDYYDPSNTETLADASAGGPNPFVAFSRFVKQLKDTPAVETVADPRSLLPRTKDGVITYDYAVVDDPYKGGAVWEAEKHQLWEAGEIPYPTYLKGRGGAVISPRVEVITPEQAEARNRKAHASTDPEVRDNHKEVEPNVYEPRRGEAIAHEIGERMTDLYDHLVGLPGFRGRYNRVEDKREKRTIEYWRTMPRNRRPPRYRDV